MVKILFHQQPYHHRIWQMSFSSTVCTSQTAANGLQTVHFCHTPDLPGTEAAHTSDMGFLLGRTGSGTTLASRRSHVSQDGLASCALLPLPCLNALPLIPDISHTPP